MPERLNPLGRSPLLRRLEALATEGQLANSLLLAGPEGSAKEAAALALARVLLDAAQGAPATKLRRLAHPDLLYVFPVESALTSAQYRELLDAKAEEPLRAVSQPSSARIPIGTADTPHPATVRSVRNFVFGRPFEAPRRVVIVADAHRMYRAAANALLKTLEEPPAHSHLFLCTHQPHLLPPTILSRCSRINVPRLSELELSGHLQAAHGLVAKEADPIATVAAGNARRAFDLMDPVARELAAWSLELVGMLIEGPRSRLLKAAEAISKATPPTGRGKKLPVDAGLSASRDVGMRVLDHLVADLLQLAKRGAGAEIALGTRQRLESFPDRTPVRLSEAARVLLAARGDLARNVNVALVLTHGLAEAGDVLAGRAAAAR